MNRFHRCWSVLYTAGLIAVPPVLLARLTPPGAFSVPDRTDLVAWIHEPLTPGFVVGAFMAAVWLLWACVAAAGLTQTYTALAQSHRRLPRLRIPGPVQGLYAATLGLVAVTNTATPTGASAAPATSAALLPDADIAETMSCADAPSHRHPPHDRDARAASRWPVTSPAHRVAPTAVAVAQVAPAVAAPVVNHAWITSFATADASAHTRTPAPALAAGRQAPADRDGDIPAWARDAPGRTHLVKAGDNLWDLAKATLGDPHRWREIYTLNRGHEQANGYALTDPDDIHTGWVLAIPAHDTAPTGPEPADPTPGGTDAAGPTPGDTAPDPATPAPSATTTPPGSAGPSAEASAGAPSSNIGASGTETAPPDPDGQAGGEHDEAGISLPSQGWVSLGLAALIVAVASLLRLQRRRRARLVFPIPARIAPDPAPVPELLAPVNAAGTGCLSAEDDQPHRPPVPAVHAPIGVDPGGAEVSLFDLPGPGLALTGAGAEPAARAVLAAALATGATATVEARPVVVITIELLARLLPEGAPLVGLDPDGTSFDGERLIVLSDIAAAVTHAEEEMIVRRRLLDTFDLDTVAALNARTDHAETQPPYVLLVEATSRHAARLLAVGAHRSALDLHPVVLGPLDGVPAVEVTAGGTTTSGDETAGMARMSTLAAADLAAVLAMLTDAAARPEPGHDIDLDPATSAVAAPPIEAPAEPVPAQPTAAPVLVQLRVLGPVLIETESGPVASGMRSGSYAVLASLAAHPGGRTLDQLTDDLHPDTDPVTAGKRIRTDISTIRRVLRAATGSAEAMFVIYDGATGRYRIDAELIAVDLWQMITTIERANRAEDDTTALAALRQAVELYGGDFADDTDQTWITDHATSYRHQILAVYARIAEITEADHPDQAVTALECALDFDPVNEELYQRIMRIHGRLNRPDTVRRTLRRLEERLADLGDAEPSEATRRVAERQLRPAGGRR